MSSGRCVLSLHGLRSKTPSVCRYDWCFQFARMGVLQPPGFYFVLFFVLLPPPITSCLLFRKVLRNINLVWSLLHLNYIFQNSSYQVISLGALVGLGGRRYIRWSRSMPRQDRNEYGCSLLLLIWCHLVPLVSGLCSQKIIQQLVLSPERWWPTHKHIFACNYITFWFSWRYSIFVITIVCFLDSDSAVEASAQWRKMSAWDWLFKMSGLIVDRWLSLIWYMFLPGESHLWAHLTAHHVPAISPLPDNNKIPFNYLQLTTHNKQKMCACRNKALWDMLSLVRCVYTLNTKIEIWACVKQKVCIAQHFSHFPSHHTVKLTLP